MGKKRAAGGVRKKGAFGRAKGGFPAPVRWQIDQDYWDKLTPDEQAWLAEFNYRFHNASFQGDPEREWTTPERRAAYRQKNAARRDCYSIAQSAGCVDFLEDLPLGPKEVPRDPSQDWSPTPDYLSSRAYREAVREFRATMPGRGEQPTARHLRAQRVLERIRNNGEIENLFPDDD